MTMLQSAAIALIQTVSQTLIILAVSPFVVGLIRKVKARLQCRRGANVLQPYSDLAKLFKKGVVISTTTSWIFTATPYILFASTLAASLLVPTFLSRVPLSFAGDVITVVSLLTVGTFFLMLAGMDAGSPFGGMGSSREAIVFSLTEPAMMLSIFAVGLTAGSTNVSTIVHNTALLQGIVTDPPPHLMALAALFIVTLAETGRVPVDNPATHLELTMIHEAMVLEYSGRYLALVEWAAAMKLLLMFTLLSNIFAPWGIAIQPDPASLAIGLGVWLAKVSALALLVGLIESMFAKLRLFRVTDLLGVAFILSLLALVFFYILRGTS
jgi:formate hydrogenlyase subunit 4